MSLYRDLTVLGECALGPDHIIEGDLVIRTHEEVTVEGATVGGDLLGERFGALVVRGTSEGMSSSEEVSSSPFSRAGLVGTWKLYSRTGRKGPDRSAKRSE